MSVRISKYPGTEVTADEARAGRFLLTSHAVELRYSWASGVATTRFLEGLREGQLWARECRRCHRTMIPPRMYCEVCFRPTDRWRLLHDTGRVVTYSVSYVNADASRRRGRGKKEGSRRSGSGRASSGGEGDDSEPIVIAVIEIDRASPMMGMLHLLAEVSLERLAVGMPVEAVWREAVERQGAITDIKYFRPIARTSGAGKRGGRGTTEGDD
jgi:uncharacterized OB-fold protein